MAQCLLGTQVTQRQISDQKPGDTRGSLGLSKCLKRTAATMMSVSVENVSQGWKGSTNTVEKTRFLSLSQILGLKKKWGSWSTQSSKQSLCHVRGGTGRAVCGYVISFLNLVFISWSLTRPQKPWAAWPGPGTPLPEQPSVHTEHSCPLTALALLRNKPTPWGKNLSLDAYGVSIPHNEAISMVVSFLLENHLQIKASKNITINYINTTKRYLRNYKC